jgi:hypothetical protein
MRFIAIYEMKQEYLLCSHIMNNSALMVINSNIYTNLIQFLVRLIYTGDLSIFSLHRVITFLFAHFML